jgi:hypothetical protein
MSSPHEKSHLQSKKFAAYMWGDTAWTLLIGAGLWLMRKLVAEGADSAILLALISLLLGMVIVKGFGQAVYVGGQAIVDKYVRVAEIITNKGDHPGEPPATPPEAK